MSKSLVAKFCENTTNRRLFIQESAVVAVSEEACRQMKERGLSRLQIARRMKKPLSWVSATLDCQREATLREWAGLFAVMGAELRITSGDFTPSTRKDTP
jgi:endonuclease/exonuclease/phosphatase family metal-dependent hydrolase